LIDLGRRFHDLFGRSARIFRAPGRVNLIGEHTDYNDGFVMPVAIQLSTWVAISPRDDDKMVVHSENYGETVEYDRSRQHGSCDLHAGVPVWSRYVFGTAAVLEEMAHSVRGANILVHTQIPIGAGLSSSAALEVAVGYALLNLSGSSLGLTDLALACQRAEHEFVGVRCGVMDQMIACCGSLQHALMLDTRTLCYELVPLSDQASVIVCNTMVKHDLALGSYNTRRAECEAAAKLFGRTLRDVTFTDLEKSQARFPENIYKRARHVVSENARVRSASSALKHGNLAEFGKLMAESHCSLRDDYQVSCPELDMMVELASELDGVYGARMTGGGFGGCTVNLVRADTAEGFRNRIAEQYRKATGLQPDVYICTAAAGVQEL